MRYVLSKPTDVPTFVEYGAADLGVCGLDTLHESRRQVYEPLLLPFGHCRPLLAGPADGAGGPLRYEQPRVATKYPNLTEEFFRQRGVNARSSRLTVRWNWRPWSGWPTSSWISSKRVTRCVPMGWSSSSWSSMHSQAVLVVNRAAYHLKAAAIQNVIQRLRHALQAGAPS